MSSHEDGWDDIASGWLWAVTGVGALLLGAAGGVLVHVVDVLTNKHRRAA